MGILLPERFTVRAMCGVLLKDGKICKDLILMLGLIESMNQLAIENSVHWYGDVLRMKIVLF